MSHDTPLENRAQYYLYLLCMDDIPCLYHNIDSVLKCFHQFFLLKLGYENPDMYFGAKLCMTRFYNGIWPWVMSTIKYVHEAV